MKLQKPILVISFSYFFKLVIKAEFVLFLIETIIEVYFWTNYFIPNYRWNMYFIII